MTGMGIHIPWAGLDLAGCKYLSGNCTLPTVIDEMGDIKPQHFDYPIEILSYYPAVIIHIKTLVTNYEWTQYTYRAILTKGLMSL